jgi:hypothetical protein
LLAPRSTACQGTNILVRLSTHSDTATPLVVQEAVHSALKKANPLLRHVEHPQLFGSVCAFQEVRWHIASKGLLCLSRLLVTAPVNFVQALYRLCAVAV